VRGGKGIKMMLKNDFQKKGAETLGEIWELIAKLPEQQLNNLPAGQTALVMIDLVNGFARQGALHSSRVAELIPEIIRLIKACRELAIPILAFADCHTEKCPEFDVYPVHCLAGTLEGELVDEVKTVGGYTLILKNSTNGFLEEDFQKWLQENPRMTNFIITGDCTDICIQQFAITLKTWFNLHDKKARIIVPANAVETYDLGVHNADLMNMLALYNMLGNGIEVVQAIG